MSITGIGSESALGVQSLVEMRRQLDDLQRQLGTGKKTDTYAGIGLDRGLVVGLRNRLVALEGFDSTITNVDVRIDLAQSALGRHRRHPDAPSRRRHSRSTGIESNGTTIAQTTAYSSLGEILGLLNTQIGDRYIFSGRAADQPAVASLSRSWTATAPAQVSSRSSTSAGRRIWARAALAAWSISAPTATSVSIAEDVVPARPSASSCPASIRRWPTPRSPAGRRAARA